MRQRFRENDVMKRMSLRTLLLCGLALSFGSSGYYLHGYADSDEIPATASQPDAGGQKSGGRPPEGRGVRDGARAGHVQTRRIGEAQAGGNAGGHSPRGGVAPGFGSRSGIHAPAIVGLHRRTGEDGPPPFSSRTPTFSHPGPGDRWSVSVGPLVAGNTPNGVGIRVGSGTIWQRFGFQGPVLHGNQEMPGQPGVGIEQNSGTEMARPGYTHSRIGTRPFRGNTFSFNNRNYNIGHRLYQPSHYRHSGYHGYWNGNHRLGGNARLSDIRSYDGGYSSGWGWSLRTGHGRHRRYGIYNTYGYRPIGWGLGGWGLGSLIYSSGYLGYSNPYYSSVSTAARSYSQPIPVIYNAPAAVVVGDQASSDQVLSDAVAAFQRNDYDVALDITNKGIGQYPDDAVLHEFRSLVLFAKQDYQQSAATIHSVLAIGPGWDWTTLSGMYASVPVYTTQLRTLEAFTKANPEDAASHFLLAYHYMTCGHTEAAARRLQQVVRLMPNDRVAADLLKMILPPEPVASSENSVTTETELSPESVMSEEKPVDLKTIVGTWKAPGADGAVFDLVLTNDAEFSWRFAPKDQAVREFDGTYTIEKNVLALERRDGGSMIAEVTPGGEGKFNFRLLGSDDTDPGLDFAR